MNHRARVRGSRRRCAEAGETLLETLVTVAVLGITMVAVMAGIGAVLRFSSSHREAASADVVISLGAEAIKATTPPSCTATLVQTAYQSSLNAIPTTVTLPAGWTINSTATSNLKITSATCDTSQSLNLQTIKLTATSTKGTATETVEIVKRSP